MKQGVDIKDLYTLKVGALWSALKAEHLSVWMLCMYFFFEYVRPQSIYPELDILPWAQLFLIASILTAFSDRSVHWVSNGQNKLMILFAIIIIVSGLFAFNKSASLEYWSVFAGWLIMYFLVISIINTETRLILFLLAYCLFSLKMAQHGAVSWAMRGFSFASYGLVGAPGWFSNSGEYAIQMLIYGSLSISMVVALKQYWGRVKKWLLYLAAAMGYMSIMGASSRGAQIGLAVIGIWMLLKMKNGFKGLIVILILATALYYLLPEEQIQRFAEMGDDRNSLQRLAYWEYAIHEVIPKHPIIGIGYHNWIYYLAFKVPEGMGPLQKVQESHNIFIQATSELGFIGLFGFIWLIIYAFINNTRTRRYAKDLNNTLIYYLTFGLDAGLIGYLVAGSFVTVLYYPFFWVQVAMIVMLNNIANRMLAIDNNKNVQEPVTGVLSVGQLKNEKIHPD